MLHRLLTAFLFPSLLALAGGLALPQSAFAHGNPHSHRVAPAAVELPSSTQREDRRTSGGPAASRNPIPRGHVRAAGESHCPPGPAGSCGCGQSVCFVQVFMAAERHDHAFAVEPHVVPEQAPDAAPFFAVFLLSAQPRAPPVHQPV